MEFSNISFLFFILPIFLVTYYFTPKFLKNYIILAFSFFMVYWGSPNLFLKMVWFAFVNYYSGYFIKTLKSDKIKRISLIFVIVADFSFLHYLSNRDYCWVYFFQDGILNKVYLAAMGMNIISYLVDIYEGRVKFTKNFIAYFLHIFTFFKFFSGPIIPYNKFKPQVEKRDVTLNCVVKGIERFVIGLFKVVVLSYEIGEIKRFVILRMSPNLSFCAAWMGAVSIFFNIYYYFSGYCDMACGLGKIVGFSFPDNFKNKIFCGSLSEFFKGFNATFTNYFKFYVFPWAKEKGRFFRFFKYYIVMYFYVACFNKAVKAIHYFFLMVFLEGLFLRKFLQKAPKIVRKIYCFVALIIGFSLTFDEEKNRWFELLKFLFGFGGVFIDKSLVFLMAFLKFFIVLFSFFVLDIFLKWLKEPKKKNLKMFEFLKYFSILILFIVSVVYCLTV